MRAFRFAYLVGAMLAVGPAVAQEGPSGQPVTLQEVLVDSISDEVWVRFRFIAPGVARDAGELDYDQMNADMTHLCESFALPYDAQYALSGDVFVISLADRATEFGVTDPEATQLFEAFRPVDNSCMLEGL